MATVRIKQSVVRWMNVEIDDVDETTNMEDVEFEATKFMQSDEFDEADWSLDILEESYEVTE